MLSPLNSIGHTDFISPVVCLLSFFMKAVCCMITVQWNLCYSDATSFPGSSPSRPLERERETLENAGHVSPRTWEMTKHNIEGGSGKSGVMVRICLPLRLGTMLIQMKLHNCLAFVFATGSVSGSWVRWQRLQIWLVQDLFSTWQGMSLSLIHIWRCRRS